MKLLLDENLSWRLVKLLADIFPQSAHVTFVALPQPAPDLIIWNFALNNGYIILTQDEDFEAIALLRGHPPKVILLRAGNLATIAIEQLLRSRFMLI
jgi:predicted nuclease of predicted toxin-antitoxin system